MSRDERRETASRRAPAGLNGCATSFSLFLSLSLSPVVTRRRRGSLTALNARAAANRPPRNAKRLMRSRRARVGESCARLNAKRSLGITSDEDRGFRGIFTREPFVKPQSRDRLFARSTRFPRNFNDSFDVCI